MSARAKRRMAVVTGIIVIVVILVLAIVGGNTAARTVSIAEALEIHDDSKIQVTGNVVENSFDIDGNVLTFKIYDPEADPNASAPLDISYDGGVSATFGNDVTAICTGKKNTDGILSCTELVTKCPSKYENAEGSLSVGELLGYGESVLGKPVKVSGSIKAGTLAGVDAPYRFVISGEQAQDELRIVYEGALSAETAEGSTVVLTGSLSSDGSFTATSVALEG